MSKIKKALAISGLAAITASLIPASAAFATAGNGDNITFCHATSSFTNPYVVITTDPDSIIQKGHGDHTGAVFNGTDKDWGDIIPAFVYHDKAGDPQAFAGLNVVGGAAILANDCTPIVIPPVVPTTEPPVVIPTTEPPVITPTTEPPVVTPTTEPPVVTPTTEPPVVTPTTEPPVVTPTTEPPVVTPTTEPPVVTPTTQPPVVVPTTEPPVVVPTTEPPVVVPTTEPPVVKPTPTSTFIGPVVPQTVVTPAPLPYTGSNTDTLMLWSVMGIGAGGAMMFAGLRKPA